MRLEISPSEPLSPDPGAIASAHAELERLLGMGQHPAVEALLLREFVLMFRGADCVLWEAFGFQMAYRSAMSVRPGVLRCFFAEDRERLSDAIALAAAFGPAAGQKHAADWDGAIERAAQALESGGVPSTAGGCGASDGGGNSAGPEETSILVPVIVRPNTGPSGTLPLYAGVSVALIAALGVGVYPRFQGGPEPELAVDGRIDDASRRAMEDSLSAIRRFGPPGAPRPSRCLFRVRWTEPAAGLTGRSATAAFLLAAAVSRSRLAPGAGERGFAPGVAITGDLDGTALRPVEPETLPAKVRAAHHAGVIRLLVPASQREIARAELRRLREREPSAELWIDGIDDLLAAWGNPAVVPLALRSARRTAGVIAGWLARSRVFLALVAVVLLGLASLLAHEALVSRNLPENARVLGGRVEVMNRWGRVCSRFDVGPYVKDPTITKAVMSTLQVADVDGDGVNEILIRTGREIGWMNLITLYDRHGRKLWTSRSDTPAGSGVIGEGDLLWRGFRVDEIPGHKAPVVFAVRSSRQGSLTVVDVLDARSGDRLGSVRNRGHLEFAAVLDLDDDGNQEHVLGGVLNEQDMAVAMVLDLGALTRRGEAAMPAWSTDPDLLGRGILAVLCFPRDPFLQSLRPSLNDFNRDAGGGVSAAVLGEFGDGKGEVLYTLSFDRDFSPTVHAARYSDAYVHRLTARNGALTVAQVRAEEPTLEARVRALTPEGFRPPVAGSSPRTFGDAPR